MAKKTNSPYSASFTGATFMFAEFNAILPLLMDENIDANLKAEVVERKHLQVNTEIAASRVLSEFKKRYIAMPERFWLWYTTLEEQAQKATLLYVILKTYRLLFEFHTSVSYKSLLGDYLRGAHTIKIVDPYLTWDYQKFNLMEFIQTVYDCATAKDGLKIRLSTKNETKNASANMEFFTELASELKSIYGIEFTFDFHAKHDRSIQVDNDWFIVPGSGLNIFEKIDSKFSMRKIRDQYKPCREFSITYNHCPEELKN